MLIKKILWALRLTMYSLVFRGIHMPGYLGKPLLWSGIRRIHIGRRVRIFPNSRFEVHEGGMIKICDNVSIGQGFHVTSQGQLTIGAGTVISGNVLVTNIDHDYADIDRPVLEQPHIVRDTAIGEDCFIGFGAVIQAGTVLGNHCVVGANSVVRGEFPDYCVIAGVPGQVVRQYDTESKAWRRRN